MSPHGPHGRSSCFRDAATTVPHHSALCTHLAPPSATFGSCKTVGLEMAEVGCNDQEAEEPFCPELHEHGNPTQVEDRRDRKQDQG